MRDSAYDPPRLTPQFWTRTDVRRALEQHEVGALFRLVLAQKISQTQLGTAVGLGQNRVSQIARDLQHVDSLVRLTAIADGLAMPDHARIAFGLAPRQAARPDRAPARHGSGDADELLRQIASARYIDADLIGVFQGETDTIRLLDRHLGAPNVAVKLEAHITHVQDALRHSLSPQRRDEGRADPRGSGFQVKITAPQRGYLAPAQAGERRQEDQREVTPVISPVGPALVGQLPQRVVGFGTRSVHLG
jgi:transcriptional regulator with XRE-family HTH domain